ncbi:MAG TPA: LCP family protein [Mycobacteriales bacterium]|nr:LCP family protein [Mycobacteriales bacterium]
MSSGKHRRPEPDPLPEVDLASRLATADTIATPIATPLATSAATSAATPVTAPAVPGQTVVARRSRAAERAARRRAMRQRVLLVTAAVLGVVLIIVGGWLVLRGGDGGKDKVAAAAPRQLTTLVQVTGADGTAAASALVGTTKVGKQAAAVLVPSRLIVDVAGSGEMPFGEAVALDDDTASTGALTDLLGVSVDDSWVLSTDGLAALVDSVGGVQAAVDVDVVTTDAKGNETVVVRAGNQKLKGAAAAAYATYLADGEPEQARLARFDDVLTAVAAALPKDHAALVAALAALGQGSRSTLDSSELADRLAVLGSAAADGTLVSDVLPVTEIDTGGAVTSYGLDAAQAAATMRARFPGSLQQDANGESVRVLVENGVGTPGLVEKARTKLVAAGFQFINGGNASPFNADPSSIQVPDGTEKSLARGRRVAAALGLPADSVIPSDRGQTVADVIVLLGSDFTP